MHILLLTDSYPPEVRSASHLMKELADGLKENGHKITVATSYPKYNLAEKKEYPEDSMEDDIRVLRIGTPPHHKVNFIIRGLAQLSMPFIFNRAIKKNIREKIDTVIFHSPPLPLTFTASFIKKNYGARYILNLHDVFPQNAVDLGIMRNPILIKFFEWMERRAYKSADILMVPSNEHKNFLTSKRSIEPNKIAVVPHWIDLAPYEKANKSGKYRELFGLQNKFVFLFAGVIGPSQGLDLILRLAEKIKDIHPNVVFLFVGDGTEKKNLIALSNALQLTNVSFEQFVSKDDYPALVKDMDVGIVTLTAKNTTPAVPGKILGYMAAGIPVLAFLHDQSEGHDIIRNAGCGFTTSPEKENEGLELVLKFINMKSELTEMGMRGEKYVKENFSREKAVKKIEAILHG